MSGRGEYVSVAPINGRMGIGAFASHIKWALVADLDEFVVRARLVEYADGQRVPQGRGIGRTVCKVWRGSGNHIVRVRSEDGTVDEWIVSADEVVPTVRLFLSVVCLRHRLDMTIVGAEQLSTIILRNTVQMVVRPIV